MPQVQTAAPMMANPALLSNASYMQQMLQAQRQQQLAQALTEQGLAPIDYDPRGRISPWQGVNKLAAALLGGYTANNAIKSQAALQAQGAQTVQGQFFGQDAGADPSPQALAAALKQSGSVPLGAPAAGGAQPTPQSLAAALSPQVAAQQAMAQGAQQGSIGPTVANAGRMDALTGQPQPAPPQSDPTGQAPQPQSSSFVIPGMSPQAAYTAYMTDPSGYMKQLAESRMPTTEQKNWTAQGVNPTLLAGGTIRAGQTNGMTDMQKMQYALSQVQPGSPQAQQLQAAIDKANYLAPTVAHQGETLLNPVTQQPYFQMPKAADGISLDWSADPMHPVASAMPGYSGANAGIQGSQAWATAGAPVITVKTPDGSEVPVRAGPAAAVGGAQIGVGGGGGVGGAATPGNAGRAPQPASAFGAPRLGQSTSDAITQKDAATAVQQAPAQAVQSKQSVAGLEAALHALQTVRATGPGTARTNDVLATLNNAGWGIGTQGVDGYQSAQKYLNNSLSTAAAGTGANGSDSRFDQFMHGNPNTDTMNLVPLEGAIRYVLSQHDANIARGQFLSDATARARAAGDPNAPQTALAQWSQIYNPQVFSFSRMAPPDRQAFKAAMTPDQQAQFGAQYNAAHSRGWVQ